MEQPTSKETKPSTEEPKSEINKVLTEIADEVPQDHPEETPKLAEFTDPPSSEKKKDKPKKEKKKKKERKKSEVEKLQDEVKALKKDVKEHQSKFAFLQAELENTRKHYIKQQKMAENRTKMRVITSFTPIIDSFEMAFKNKEKLVESDDSENCQVANFIKGFEAINTSLKSIFANYKVTPIEDINIPFDYKRHEVMLKTINDEIEEDTVLQVVQKGYRMDGEVIRPAKVIVSKKTPPPPPPKPEPKPEAEPEVKSEEDTKKQATETVKEEPKAEPTPEPAQKELPLETNPKNKAE